MYLNQNTYCLAYNKIPLNHYLTIIPLILLSLLSFNASPSKASI